MHVLIVLGGGVDKKGAIPPWIQARLETTLNEWQTGEYDLIVASGKGRADMVETEAGAMARILMERGVPEDKIVTETNLNQYNRKRLLL